MNETPTLVEDRLRREYQQLAESHQFSVRSVAYLPRRRRPARRVILAVAGALVVASVAVGTVISTNSDSSTSVRTRNEPTDATTTLPAPTGAGTERPLRIADTPDTQFLIRLALRRDPASAPFAIATATDAPIVITNDGQMTIAAVFGSAGYQGVGAGDASTTLIATNPTGVDQATTTKWYIAWTKVPAGTSYVVWHFQTTEAWQRPINNASYITVEGSDPATPGTHPLLGTAQAFDAAGQPIGEAHLNG